jgi:hypothetical protein
MNIPGNPHCAFYFGPFHWFCNRWANIPLYLASSILYIRVDKDWQYIRQLWIQTMYMYIHLITTILFLVCIQSWRLAHVIREVQQLSLGNFQTSQLARNLKKITNRMPGIGSANLSIGICAYCSKNGLAPLNKWSVPNREVPQVA